MLAMENITPKLNFGTVRNGDRCVNGSCDFET
jgi:hypothetical protein